MDELDLNNHENRIPFGPSLQPNELAKKNIALEEVGKELNGP